MSAERVGPGGADHRLDPDGLSDFVEHLGVYFEAQGVPRSAGRLLGWLILCDPPEQSADDLATALQASSGGISTAARLLTSGGYVERVGRSGDRRAYYRVRPGAWTAILAEQATSATRLRQIAEEGVTALDGQPAARRRRAEELLAFAHFLERELPALARRYVEETRT